MTREKRSSAAMVMAYRKAILQIETEISDLEQQNSKLLGYDDLNKLKEKCSAKREEFSSKLTQIQKLSNEIEESRNKSGISLSEIRSLQEKYEAEKKETESIKSELDSLQKEFDNLAKGDNLKYIELIRNRKIIKEKLELLEKSLDEKELEDLAKLQAIEKKSTPFGPITVTKNLYENISKSLDWQIEFGKKYKLELKEDKTQGKLQFETKEKDIQIEIDKEKISGKWVKGKDQIGVSMLVELYLKAIENQKVDKHVVEGKDFEVTKLIELELAKQLRTKGLEKGEINNKKIDEILNSEPAKKMQA